MTAIFLIDDDEDDREIFQAALDTFDFPHSYVEAVDGEDGLNKLNDPSLPKPDLIFLDLNMPRVDGRQFLAAIKQLEAFKAIPVIIYSTSSLDADKEKAFSSGASGFMTKHTSFNDLCFALRELLEEKNIL